jgi:serine/threonine protein kinase
MGPFVLFDELPAQPFRKPLLARRFSPGRPLGPQQTVLLLDTEALTTHAVRDQLARLTLVGRTFDHPACVVPHEMITFAAEKPEISDPNARSADAGTRTILVARQTPGFTLSELLVRRGRMPADVVLEIARRLAEGLAALELAGLVHGDIRTDTVRISKSGEVTLVDAGVRPALDPELTIHTRGRPEYVDGAAPELIDSGQSPTPKSDMYSFGCLLWTLLAGRPPFLGGDPLMKLTAHRTRRIEDIRKLAPDTPDAMAVAIRSLTESDPMRRPIHFGEISRRFGRSRSVGRNRIARYARDFNAPLLNYRVEDLAPFKWNWSLTAAALFFISGLAATLADAGARNQLLTLAPQWMRPIAVATPPADQSTSVAETGTSDSPDNRTARAPIPNPRSSSSATTKPETPVRQQPRSLPAPDPRGVISLPDAGPYILAETSEFVGPVIMLRGTGSEPAVVLVDPAVPLKLSASSVRLENIAFVVDASADTPDFNRRFAVGVYAQELHVSRCVFRGPCESIDTPGGVSAANPRRGTLLAWSLVDKRDATAGRATLEHSLFVNDGPALHVNFAARQVRFDNVLRIGSGPVCQLNVGDEPRPGNEPPIHLVFTHVTCRNSGPILRHVVSTPNHVRPVSIVATESAWHCRSSSNSVWEYVGTAAPDALRSLTVRGDATLVDYPGDTPLLQLTPAVRPGDPPISTPLDITIDRIDGIERATLKFADGPSLTPNDSVVLSSDAPTTGEHAPGIVPGRLPRLGGQ